MAHTKESIHKEIDDALTSPGTLYRQPFTKRAGHQQRLSEIAAAELRRRSQELTVPKSKRGSGHYSEDRAKLADDAKKKRPQKYTQEKWDARVMLGQVFDDIGEIIDFETPLVEAGRSKENVDLLAYNKDTNTLTLLEYKTKENREPLLRCVLEIFTYGQRINEKKFLADFNKSPFQVPIDAKIRTAVFVHKDSKPYKHFHQGENTEIRRLMRELKVDFFAIE